MQKSKIEWCDSTWNPITGCLHGCPYCYARRIAERFDGCDHPTNSRELFSPLIVTRKDGRAVDAAFPFGFKPTFHRYRLEEPQRQKKPQNMTITADRCGKLPVAVNVTGWVPASYCISEDKEKTSP